LGSQAPEDKAPVGMYEHAAYTNRYPNNKISPVKYIKPNRKIYDHETKSNGTTVYTHCKRQNEKEHSYSQTTLHNTVSRDIGKLTSHSRPIYSNIT
jgi:hypothetical protein